MGKRRPYLAIYGQIAICKVYCAPCRCYAFAIDHTRQCCGRRDDDHPKRGTRECPRQELREAMLRDQRHRCVYCDQRFLVYVKKDGKYEYVRLRVTWDQLVPFSCIQDHPASNWVAACQVCHSWIMSRKTGTSRQANHLFTTIEERRRYVRTKWKEARRRVPALPKAVCAD